jgi:hypothetical protein
VSRRTLVTACIAVLLASPAAAQQDTAHKKATMATYPAGAKRAAGAAMSDAALVRNALSAAPKAIAEHAAVIVPDSSGKMRTLREGTNGWTCVPNDPGTPGNDPICFDEQGMKWAQSWMNHDEKPANTAPGIAYMLQGGSDVSAKDPWQKTTTHFVASPPHWMLLWPVDSATSGLSTKPKKTGTWIMWAGTPYAHLMINQIP